MSSYVIVKAREGKKVKAVETTREMHKLLRWIEKGGLDIDLYDDRERADALERIKKWGVNRKIPIKIGKRLVERLAEKLEGCDPKEIEQRITEMLLRLGY